MDARNPRLSTAYLGLGSNLGDRLVAMRAAIQALDDHARIRVDFEGGVAPLYETSPVGGPPGQGPFINSAVRIGTALSGMDLVCELLSIEQSLGRCRGERWDARVIDIDLLLFDDLVVKGDKLSIPHPRMHTRRFVLDPLAEIAGDVIHPVLHITVSDLAGKCRSEPKGERVELLASGGWYLKATAKRSVPGCSIESS